MEAGRHRGGASSLLALLLVWVAISAAAHGDEALRVELADPQAIATISQPWRFQPGDDPAWADPEFDDSDWSERPVPERWPEGGYPESGQMGWYRISLQLDPQTDVSPILALRVGKVMSAYELYAGGQLIGGLGQLPPDGEVYYNQIRVLLVPPVAIDRDGRLVLALRVWGGPEHIVDAWYGGPYSDPVRIGSHFRIAQREIASRLAQLAGIALFLGFGVYHLYLYHRNRQLRLFLWFGLMTLNIGLYCLTLSQWKYTLGWDFMLLQKLEYASAHLLPAVSIQMLWAVLGRPISTPMRIYQLCFVTLSVLGLIAPGLAFHYQTLKYWHALTIPILFYAPWVMLREMRAGNAEARTLMPGVVVFAAACLADIYFHYQEIQNLRLVPFGFAAIVISMQVSLANSFTSMLGRLEEEVNRRTAALSEANLQLAEVARADPLTGLLNRRGFLEEASTEVQRFYRSGRTFSLVLGDVDHFKRFNDNYGHACGDYVLKRVANILTERLRDVDRVARWGGEEFILLLPETDTQGAAVLADKLRKIIADSVFHFEGETIGTTMTFGVASFRKDESLDNCIARADTAMYHGKKAGRNKVMLGGFRGLTLVN